MFMYLWVRLCQIVFNCFNQVLKLITGRSTFSGTRKEVQRHESYEHSVHRFNILAQGKMIETEPASFQHFLLTHNDYVHPDELKVDNVALLSVTDTHALFVEGPPGFNFYGSEESPFTFIVHFDYARHLLAIRLDHFLTFAKALGKPKVNNIIFICTTGRCGSTLLTQMMDQLPNTLSMSEPDFITLLNNGNGENPKSLVKSRSDSDELLRALIYVQCKKLNDTPMDNVVIKLRPSVVAIAHRIAHVCPEIKHLFAYRSPERTVASFINTVKVFPTWVFQLVFKKYVWKVYKSIKPDDEKLDKFFIAMIQDSMGNYEHVRCWTQIVLSFYLFCKTYKDQGLVNFLPVAYEELTADPRDQMKKILFHCGIESNDVQDLMSPLEKDSQEGSKLSRDNVSRYRIPDFTETQFNIIDKVMDDFGFPKLANWQKIFDSPDENEVGRV